MRRWIPGRSPLFLWPAAPRPRSGGTPTIGSPWPGRRSAGRAQGLWLPGDHQVPGGRAGSRAAMLLARSPSTPPRSDLQPPGSGLPAWALGGKRKLLCPSPAQTFVSLPPAQVADLWAKCKPGRHVDKVFVGRSGERFSCADLALTPSPRLPRREWELFRAPSCWEGAISLQGRESQREESLFTLKECF